MSLLAHAADAELPVDVGRAGRQPVRLLEGAARRAAAPDRRDDQGLGDHAALPPARRRARAAGQARLPARGLRQVPDEALDRAVQPRRPRPARPDRGGRRLHGLACTPTPAARSASSTTTSSARTTSPTGAWSWATPTSTWPPSTAPLLAIAGRGDGIAPIAACHHVGDLAHRRRRGAARDRAGRSSRRADRARGARDDVGDARRLARSAGAPAPPRTPGCRRRRRLDLALRLRASCAASSCSASSSSRPRRPPPQARRRPPRSRPAPAPAASTSAG